MILLSDGSQSKIGSLTVAWEHFGEQTIARANRVFAGKPNGLIPDYVGVFRNLQKALASYGTLGDGMGGSPVASKEALLKALEAAVAEATACCTTQGVNAKAIQVAEAFARVALMEEAVDRLVAKDEIRRKYLGRALTVDTLFAGLLPHPDANLTVPAQMQPFIVVRVPRFAGPTRTSYSFSSCVTMDSLRKTPGINQTVAGAVARTQRILMTRRTKTLEIGALLRSRAVAMGSWRPKNRILSVRK